MWDMILDWVALVSRQFWSEVSSMMPDPPPELAGACGAIAGAADWLSPAAGFVPWAAMAVALGFLLTGLVVGIGIMTARIVASFATLGGGGT